MVQNKMHFAVHGHTAAELIMERADHTKDHMGLTTWQDAPDGKIKKSDVSIAKNYLTEDELGQLNAWSPPIWTSPRTWPSATSR